MVLIPDVCFPDAEEPWIPTLLDIEYRKSNNTPGYAGIGLDGVVVSPEHTRMTAAWSRLVQRFNQRYAYRMINCETLERWQVRLQNRTDEIIDEYERAYRLYEEYADDMDDPIDGWTDDMDTNDTNTGTDRYTIQQTTRAADTPNGAINLTDNYGDAVTKQDGNNTTTYGRVLDRTVSSTRAFKGVKVLEDVIRSIKGWRDLDTMFVEEYENLFLNIFWY